MVKRKGREKKWGSEEGEGVRYLCVICYPGRKEEWHDKLSMSSIPAI